MSNVCKNQESDIRIFLDLESLVASIRICHFHFRAQYLRSSTPSTTSGVPSSVSLTLLLYNAQEDVKVTRTVLTIWTMWKSYFPNVNHQGCVGKLIINQQPHCELWTAQQSRKPDLEIIKVPGTIGVNEVDILLSSRTRITVSPYPWMRLILWHWYQSAAICLSPIILSQIPH